MNILVLGGSGGIGAALISAIELRYPSAVIYATYATHLPEDLTHVTWFKVDLRIEQEIEALAAHIPSIDWIINTVGVLTVNGVGPEKSLRQCDGELFKRSMEINALPTLLVCKYFIRHLRKSSKPIFSTVSARVGSIADNRLGGWYSYRSSKAALNMIIKNISIEWQLALPKGCIVALHPGTTDTNFSKPFQAGVPEDKLFSPAKTANLLLDVMDGLDAKDSGRFIAYDGSDIAW